MDEESILEYRRRFDKTIGLKEPIGNVSYKYFEINEEYLRSKQQELADSMLENSYVDDKTFLSSAFISYGFRLGSVFLNGKIECYTRQNGYFDNAIWTYNLDDVLNYETNEENLNSGSSNIIEWSINPGSNVDISDDVLRKMIVPLVNNLNRITPPGKTMNCICVLPPMSNKIEINGWPSLFSSMNVNRLKISVTNYGHLLRINEEDRAYVVLHQTDDSREYVIISAYEYIRGHNMCIGSVAFDVSDFDHQYLLNDIQPISFTIENDKREYCKGKNIIKENGWNYLQCKYPTLVGLNSFLGQHEASFGREMYKLVNSEKEANNEISKAIDGFIEQDSLSAFDISAHILAEPNLCNISLGDLVYITDRIQRDKRFEAVSITTGRHFELGSIKKFGPFVDMTNINMIPSNYSTFTWKLRDKRKKIVSYFSLSAQRNGENQIIESIIDHYKPCTTELIAEDLLYFYKNGEKPSAYFVAKVFMYLSQMDSIEIDSRNEIVF